MAVAQVSPLELVAYWTLDIFLPSEFINVCRRIYAVYHSYVLY